MLEMNYEKNDNNSDTKQLSDIAMFKFFMKKMPLLALAVQSHELSKQIGIELTGTKKIHFNLDPIRNNS